MTVKFSLVVEVLSTIPHLVTEEGKVLTGGGVLSTIPTLGNRGG